jgi:hypothetical protein
MGVASTARLFLDTLVGVVELWCCCPLPFLLVWVGCGPQLHRAKAHPTATGVGIVDTKGVVSLLMALSWCF